MGIISHYQNWDILSIWDFTPIIRIGDFTHRWIFSGTKIGGFLNINFYVFYLNNKVF
jgi:hypothetical protein